MNAGDPRESADQATPSCAESGPLSDEQLQLRPELAFGPNPFIEALPPAIAYADFPKRLQHSPLVGVNWSAIGPSSREHLLAFSSEHFVPTAAVIEPAAGLQTLMRRALLLRNPLLAAERKRVNQVGVVDDRQALRRVSQLDGAGLLLKGMTGSGKSELLSRTLRILAPRQVIDHSPSQECGWLRLRQCVYLKIDFASNGSRGGLLKRILEALDEALGTDYLNDHRRVVSIDPLLVIVCKLLSLHRVAILVIDEKQQSSFEDSPWRLEFVLFYLTLMNLGISVALAGNPLAFEHLKYFSQVMRRFSAGGVHSLEPGTHSPQWWSRDFVPGARKFNLVGAWDITEADRCKFESDNSGGLPGLYMPYHVEVQRSALRRMADRVTKEDFLAAEISPRFREMKEIALALRSSSGGRPFVDVPPTLSGPSAEPRDTRHTARELPSEQTVDVVKRLLRQFTTEQTRKANTLAKQLSALKSLTPEDIRALGVNEDLLSEMKRMTSAEGKRKARTKKSPSDSSEPSSSSD